MIGLSHLLTISDVMRGIQALSQSLLGNMDLWPDIVNANNLVPPYLTFNPSLVYGTALDTQSLLLSVVPGATQTVLSYPSVSPQLWLAGDRIVFSTASTIGLVTESQTIKSYDGTTLEWFIGLQNGYPKGSAILSYAPNIMQSKVLMPGQVIYLPLADTSSSFVVTTLSQLTDVLGLDAAGPIKWSPTGDLLTVSGLATLIQRIKAVLLTPIGSLPQSPNFGSRVALGLGDPTNSLQEAAYVRQSLLTLPEIAQVTNIQVSVLGDIVMLSATIQISTGAVLSLLNEPLT